MLCGGLFGAWSGVVASLYFFVVSATAARIRLLTPVAAGLQSGLVFFESLALD